MSGTRTTGIETQGEAINPLIRIDRESIEVTQ